MRFLRKLAVVFIAVVALPALARAEEDRLSLYLRAFDEMALWHDGKTPVPIRKWTGPLRVRMTGPMSSSYDELVMERLQLIADLAGIAVERLPPDAKDENFLVQFDETSGYIASGRQAGCLASSKWNGRGEITHVTLHVNLQVGFGLRRCIIHELMHGFGFPGHPHTLNSVLSYVYAPEKLTDLDQMAVRTLYDPRTKAAMYALPALLAARQIIAERLDLVQKDGDTSALGKDYLKTALGYLTAEGEKGNAFVQAQLGNAYSYGQFVERDEMAAARWWRLAAQQNHPDAQFRLGFAAATGRGTAKDPVEAARLYNLAADRGHAIALNNLAILYRDGRGVERDSVTAYMLFEVASARGYDAGAQYRDKIAAGMTAEEIAEAKRKAAAWQPKR